MFYFIALVLTLFAAPALACEMIAPYFDPAAVPSDLIIDGVVAARGPTSEEPFADVRIHTVHVGVYRESLFRLQWLIASTGRCLPLGPDVDVGEKVIIYLRKARGEFYPQNWLRVTGQWMSREQVVQAQATALLKVRRRATRPGLPKKRSF